MKKIVGIIILTALISNGFAVASSLERHRVMTAPVLSDLQSSAMSDMNTINVLVIIPDRYGANTYFNLDNMELFGWKISLAGTQEIMNACSWAEGSLGIPDIRVDVLLQDIDDITDYNAVAIMPAYWRSGNAYGDLLESPEALQLISSAVDNRLAVWATCAGVRVLAAADVLDGVRVTGRAKYRSEYEAAGAIYLGENIPPVIDGTIITTMRGQYWNKENIEAIATVLEQREALKGSFHTYSEHGVMAACSSGGLWTKTYGGPSADGGRSLCSTEEGTYVVAGYTSSFGSGATDMYAMNIDETGGVLWSNAYGGAGWEYGYGMCPAHDGGYLLTGYSTSFGDGSKDVFVVKIDENGNEDWMQTYGGIGLDVGMSVCQTDEGYLVAGYTESFGAGENDMYVIGIDQTGAVLWEKQLGGTAAELGYEIQKTSDGNFVLVGASGSDRANYDVYLAKIAANGDLLWENFYGAPGNDGGYDRGHAVIETSDGGFAIVGESNYGDALNMLVVKTDAEGEQVWVQVYGERLHDHGSDIIQTADGNYVICGRADNSTKGSNNMFLLKIDTNGQELWRNIIAMSGNEWGITLAETTSEDLIIVGHTNSFGQGQYDILVMKTDSDGHPNAQPKTPAIPSGPSSGNIKTELVYSTVTTDPEEEDIYYLFDWGDGTTSDWIGPYVSGDRCEAMHTWDAKGTYDIRVKARDVNGGESEWSDSLSVIMPKNRLRSLVQSWLEQILQQFFVESMDQD